MDRWGLITTTTARHLPRLLCELSISINSRTYVRSTQPIIHFVSGVCVSLERVRWARRWLRRIGACHAILASIPPQLPSVATLKETIVIAWSLLRCIRRWLQTKWLHMRRLHACIDSACVARLAYIACWPARSPRRGGRANGALGSGARGM